ncbi:hypothetical protein B0H16DRAFT_403935 [Mycena metata]|uniref:Secreted protein n=1 Tax=Mycena metata TaxID=1033252 RepID=A0AAD7HFV7_9AGAR|nr:hypothetical protein B0H16DRAFT_403935 [Mycena metata]
MSRGNYMQCWLVFWTRFAELQGLVACSRSMLVPPAFLCNTYNHSSPCGVYLDRPRGLERITNIGIEAECSLCAFYALVQCARVGFFPLRLVNAPRRTGGEYR